MKQKIFAGCLLGCFCLLGLSLLGPTTRVSAHRFAQPAAPGRSSSETQNNSKRLPHDFTAKLPLTFEENLGQLDRRAQFSARGAGYNLFLTSTGAVLERRQTAFQLNKRIRRQYTRFQARERQSNLFSLELEGANANAVAKGVGQLAGHSNYLIGNDPTNWHVDVPMFSAVRYDAIYPGISLTYYGNQQQLEYDFVVEPGADPATIRMNFPGVRLRISEAGELILSNSNGELKQRKPVLYQKIDGQKQIIDGHFAVLNKNQVTFAVGSYDRTKPLVIDPTLVYSTYLGGTGDDLGSSIAVDSSNNIYIAGTTSSVNFPLQGAAFGTNAGLDDIFVTKIDAAGANILYSTYVGGSGQDRGDGIAIDSTGNAYVVGRVDSMSTNFPSTPGSFAPNYRGGDFDGVVFKLNAQGNGLVYSGFLGGEENDAVEGITVDPGGIAYVTGGTKSIGFPTTVNAYQATRAGDTDAFLAKINSAGSALLYATYLGGSGTDRGSGVAIDSSGNAYVSGFTSASDFPTDNAFQSSFGGSFDAFVAKFDTNASGAASLVFCSYLGGTGDDKAYGLAIDNTTGNLYIGGQTSSNNFPLLNPAQPAFGGSFDGFIAKVSTAGTKVYATYLGGSGDDRITGIAVNPSGAAYVTGFTSSTDFPTVTPVQISNAGGFDLFVAKLNPAGSAFQYSTYLGGSANDSQQSTGTLTNPIALDAASDVYITGYTISTDFPTVNPLQPANAGSQDAFIIKVTDTVPAADYSISVSPASRTVAPGGNTTYTVTATPVGGFTGTISLAASGISNDTTAGFSPTSIVINDASAKSSTLTLTTTAGTPPGTYSLSVDTISGNLQHSGGAQLFVSGSASANLAITKTASPNPATSLTGLTYRITVTNNGPSPATNVVVTDTLPPGPTLVSAIPTQGSCSGSATVSCNLGSLANAGVAIVNITVTPQTTGQLSNTASVVATETDPNSNDNSVTIQTTVNAPANGPSMIDPNLMVSTLVSGLDQPTAMAFPGPNDLFVIEKASGKVKFVQNGVVQLTALDLAVNSASERGLLGIALHPNFAVNHYVYLYWTESSTAADSANLAEVAVLGNRVDRYIWNGAALTFDRNLIKLRAYQADANQPLRGNHNGGVLRFGPDLKIYILMGDNGRRGFLQNNQLGPVPDDQYGGPEPDDNHLTGFVLRLNDDGTTPTDNPFANVSTSLTGEAAANIRKLYAYGVRNGFGLAFDPLAGFLWDQENGDDAFDEMNRITAGANNGWVEVMGPISRVAEFKSIESAYGAGNLQQIRWPTSLIADTPAGALAQMYMLPGAQYHDPEFSWKYALAPAGIGFVKGRGLGTSYEGDMFVGASRTTLLNGFLFQFKFTPDRKHFKFTDSLLNDLVADNIDKFDVTESDTLVAGRDFGVVTDIQTGPNGSVFAASLLSGAIYEIKSKPSTVFYANLTGSQEVPANNSTATGAATVILSPDETTAIVSLNFSGLTSVQTNAHIHSPGPVGVTAPVLFGLPGGQVSDFRLTVTPAQVQDLKNGLWYINVHSSNFLNGEIRGQFQTSATASSVQFAATQIGVGEGEGRASLTVTRTGNISGTADVNYTTLDPVGGSDCSQANTGSASATCDYKTSAGTLHFAVGQTLATITIPIVDDSYAEGSGESFIVGLSNPSGSGVVLSSPSTVIVSINDNDTVNGPNPIGNSDFFVRQHYLDFLNREPDPNGFAFWKNEIDSCGANLQCIEVKRINVSAAFFLSIEFQESGDFIYRAYKGALGRQPNYAEFISDRARIPTADGVTPSKTPFLFDFVGRPEFTNKYPSNLGGLAFIDPLLQTVRDKSGVDLSNLRIDLLQEWDNCAQLVPLLQFCRARMVERVVNQSAFRQAVFSESFVLMEYFGYLRRNPNDPPDTDFSGYNFWLNKLNQFNGNFVNAEMVKAFIVSGEYRQRFGP